MKRTLKNSLRGIISLMLTLAMVLGEVQLPQFTIVARAETSTSNNAPSVSGITGENINEGEEFTPIILDNYVTDEDEKSQIKWKVSGNKQLIVNISDERIVTIKTPDKYWNGSEDITFTATDTQGASGSLTVNFNVESVNTPPEVKKIPDQTIDEGKTFTKIKLDDYVTDHDHPKNQILWEFDITPTGNEHAEDNLTVEIDPNRVASVIIPDPNWYGSANIKFTATDGEYASDSTSANFVVNPVNDAPVINNIPDQTIEEKNEFQPINLNDYVTDVDDDVNDLSWTYSGNNDLIVSISDNHIATVKTPNKYWIGSEIVTFTATDPAGASAIETVKFIVNISKNDEFFGALSDGCYTLTNETYTLTDDVYTHGYIYVPEGVSATIDLNGHTIDRGLAEGEPLVSGNVITAKGDLTLIDSSADNTGTITGGNNKGNGGGVYVAESGRFTMEGGNICGNKANNGIGVCVDDESSFTLKDGSIFDNGTYTGDGVCSSDGGGVYVGLDSTFTMIGGRIYANTANNGGGVFSKGSFTMSSGSISHNSAIIERYRAGDGGGVYVVQDSTFTMSGNAVIELNHAEGDGGGVCESGDGSTFIMSGNAAIKNNDTYKKESGGGIYISSNAKMSVSGSVVISGNKYFYDETASNIYISNFYDNEYPPCITIDGELTGTIGISCGKTLQEDVSSNVAIAGEGYSLTEDTLKHFFSDVLDYYVYYDDETLKFDTYYNRPEDMEVPDLFYNGADQAITVSINGITLEPNEDYTVAYSPKTPYDAGEYTATISSKHINGKQVKKTFKVLKISIPSEAIAQPVSKTGLTYSGSAQELIEAGSVNGDIGTMYYTVTPAAETSAPDFDGTDNSANKKWNISVPTAVNAGSYKVWYRVKGDVNHNDLVPDSPISVTIAKVDYTGMKTASATVRSDKASTNASLTLPELPEGAKYGDVTVGGTTGLISGTPSVAGRILTFSTTAQGDKTSAAITIKVSGATNYNDYDVVVTITAKDKEKATVTINNGSDRTVTYGDTGFTLSKSVSNAGTAAGSWTFKSSNTSVATVTNTGAVTIISAGTADITAEYESETHIGSAYIKLTINRKTVTITGVTANDKEYDGNTTAAVKSSGILSGVAAGDDVSIKAGTASFADKNAGNNKTVSFSGFSLSGSEEGNYTLSDQPANTRANINKRTASLKWTNTEFIYDGSSHCPEASVTNLVTGDSCTVTVSGAKTAANAEGSTYTATAASLSNSNYTLPPAVADKSVSFVINKAQPEITKAPAAVSGLEYDGTSHALISGGSVNIGTIVYALTRSDEEPSQSAYSTSIPTAKAAGDYYVWYKVPGTTNYSEIPAQSIQLSIAKRVVTVSGIKARNKTYDATTNAQTDTASAVINGRVTADSLGVNAELEFADALAGTDKKVNIKSITLSGSASANYVLSESGQQTSTSANIAKRPVTVSASAQRVSLNVEIDKSVSMASINGAVEGHELSSVSLSADTAHKTSNGTINVSDAHISGGNGDVTDNYDISYVSGKLTVLLGDAASITAAPAAKESLSYNGAAQELVSAGTVSGGSLLYAIGNEDTEPSSGWSEDIPEAEDADTYYVWYMAEGDEDHDDSEAGYVEVSIAKKAVSVNVLDQTVSLNAAINGSVSMAQISGLVDGHTLYSVRLTSSSTAHVTEAGEITASNAVIRNGNNDVTSNYDFSYIKGKLTVTAVEAAVTTAPAARVLVYNAEPQQLVSSNAAAEGGEFRYALSTNGVTAPAEGFGESVPTATDAGTYHVWYMIEADTDHLSTAPVCVDVTIAPAEYAIRYDKNDGSGAVVSQNKTIGKAGEKATISVNDASREGYMFKGWNDKADGSGRPYKNGDEYTPVRKEDKSFADLTIYAQWEAVSLNSISINKAPDKTEYLEGERFDTKGMVVVANYTDASSKEVTAYTYAPSGSLAVSDNKIIVSYTEGDITCIAEQPISVSENVPETVSLNSISINKAPDKTEYLEGESFDPAGMVVVANYTDNTSKEVTAYTYTPSTNLALTDDKVTVSYTEDGITRTAIQKISVSANEPEVTVSLNSISITTAPAKTAYKEGEKFDPTGMVLTAAYTDESTKEVTGYTCTPAGELTVSDNIITISYTEGGITCTAEQKISVSRVKTEEEELITEDEDYFIWNLYADSEPKSLKIKGVSVNEVITNSNSKSVFFYKASLSGNTINVTVTGDLKNAAKAENSLLEFKTADGSVIEYTLPVEYKKPELKLSATSVTIKKGTDSKVQTTVLYKTAGGNYEPLDLTGGKAEFAGKAAEIAEDGVISFTANDAAKGKISITGEGWNAKDPVELTFTIKASKKDVLNVDLGGAKNIVVNKNAKDQVLTFPVYLNGERAGKLDIADKANSGLASYADGVITVAYPAGADLKAKTYTITLSNGEAKTSVKIRVSNKDLAKSISLKVQSKYDVVTGQKMVIVPGFKDVDGELTGVSITDKNYSAVINEAGNIVVDYNGDALDAKHLKMGNLTFKLKISDVEEEVSVTIKNVKAKKTTVTVKAAKVKMNGSKATAANLICSYKDPAGNMHLIAPVSTIVVKPSNVKAVVSDDPTVINISDLSKKSGSVKLKLTFAGGVTKTVTVKVAK